MNKRRLNSKIIAVLLICLIISIFSPMQSKVVEANHNEYHSLRELYLELLTGGSFNTNLPEYAGVLSSLNREAAQYWDSMNAHHVWDDIETGSSTISADLAEIYSRLQVMALAYATQGTDYYQDQLFIDDVISGLEWSYQNRYNENVVPYDNWWHWQIGITRNLNDMMVLMYDDLTSTQRTNYLNAVYHFSPTATDINLDGELNPASGANRVWISKVAAISGILKEDSARIADASDALDEVFLYVEDGDGFYTDGSYIQHKTHPYIGGYGQALFRYISEIVWLLDSSTWEVDASELQHLFDWPFKFFEPQMYEDVFVGAVIGRNISRNSGLHGSGGLLKGLLLLSEMSGNPYVAEHKEWVKYLIQLNEHEFYSSSTIWDIVRGKQVLDDITITPREEKANESYVFYNQDVVHHYGDSWLMSLRMHSNRISMYEAINSENQKGWYTGDGMTYLYNNRDDYGRFYFATVDPFRLPGTTVDRAINRGKPYKWSQNLGTEAFVGGTEFNDSYSVASMSLHKQDVELMDLRAKKSWFMFDDEVVAIGTGISNSSGRATETIIENRRIDSDGSNALTVNGSLQSTTDGWSQTLNNVEWIHLEGTGGYYFPNAGDVEALREQREGEGTDINLPISTYAGTDEFDEASLDGSWQWIRENDANWSLTGSALRITTEEGTIEGSPNTAHNILLKQQPTGDFYVKTKLKFAPSDLSQEAGILIYQDDHNYVKLSKKLTSSGVEIVASDETNAVLSTSVTAATYNNMTDEIYLKIDKSGEVYSLYSSTDDMNWGNPIAQYTHSFNTDVGEIVSVGLFAQNGANSTAANISAEFDRFELKHTNHFVTLWVDHGIDPLNESYEYVLLPGKISTEVSAYASSPDIIVEANNQKVQAVRETSLGMLGATFWESSGDQHDYVSASNGSIIMVKDTGDELEVAVSDPTQQQSKVVVELNKFGISSLQVDPSITVLQLSPTIKFEVDVSNMRGKTYKVKFSYDNTVTNLPPNAPTGFEVATQNAQTDTDEIGTELYWDAVNGASSYSVYRKAIDGQVYTQIANTITATQYTDNTVYAGKVYEYVVRAVNTNGESSDSDSRTVLIRHIKVEAAEDAYVRGGNYANINYGSKSNLVVKAAPADNYNRKSYVKFNLDHVDADSHIISAKLYVYGRVNDTNGTQSEVWAKAVAEDDWSEDNLTFNNAPSEGNSLTGVEFDSSGNWRALDVTSYVQSEATGDQVASFALTETNNLYVGLSSKEAPSDRAPYLKINIAERNTVKVAEYAMEHGNTTSSNHEKQLYLKFNLNELEDNKYIVRAKLHVYGRVSETNADVSVYGVDNDSWTGKIWDSKRALASDQSTPSVESSYSWHSFDVTDYTQAQYGAGNDTAISLALIQDMSHNGLLVSFGTKESANMPYLELQLADILQLQPSDDAFVRGGNFANDNYGTRGKLTVKDSSAANYTRQSFLKFDLNNTQIHEYADIIQAELHIRGSVIAATTGLVKVHEIADDSWTDAQLTWNNKPTKGGYIATITMDDQVAWRSVPVTEFVNQENDKDGFVSLSLLQDNTDGLTYNFYSQNTKDEEPYMEFIY